MKQRSVSSGAFLVRQYALLSRLSSSRGEQWTLRATCNSKHSLGGSLAHFDSV
jgi:hypothetical protein